MPGFLPAWLASATACEGRQHDGAEEGSWRTLIFVDVDGVLNVGVAIKGEAPINLTHANLERAVTLEGQRNFHADRVLAVAKRRLDFGEGSTYAKLVSDNLSDISEVLTSRLAEIIRSAGDGCTVVLSSSWRKHARRVRRLQKLIGMQLGRTFIFDDCTPVRSENGAEERLESIGQYLAELGRSQPRALDGVRVLVLEDFCINSLRNILVWKSDSGSPTRGPKSASEEAFSVDCVKDAECYLGAQAEKMARDVRVKVVHTYDSWTAPEGFPMEVGSGLTMGHFREALDFLGHAGAIEGIGGEKQNLAEAWSLQAAVAAPQRKFADELRDERACGREAINKKQMAELAGNPDLLIPGQA